MNGLPSLFCVSVLLSLVFLVAACQKGAANNASETGNARDQNSRHTVQVADKHKSPELPVNQPQSPNTSTPKSSTPLADLRAGFKTKLNRSGAAPQEFENEKPPAGVSEITFKSGELTLKAWRSALPKDGKKHPAIVFAHGGFSFGGGDFEVLTPFIKQGWVALALIFRGENGGEGVFDLFLGEIDDLIAAGNYVASLDEVNAKQVFAVGHSVGGTRCIVASMLPSPFRAIGAISGAADIRLWLQGQEELAPFDVKDAGEIRVRNPWENIASLSVPLILGNGADETGFTALSESFVSLARKQRKNVDHFTKPGDHFTCVEGVLEETMRRFRRIADLDD